MFRLSAYRFRREKAGLDLVTVSAPYGRLLLEAQTCARVEPAMQGYQRAELSAAASALTAASSSLAAVSMTNRTMALLPCWADLVEEEARLVSAAAAAASVTVANANAAAAAATAALTAASAASGAAAGGSASSGAVATTATAAAAVVSAAAGAAPTSAGASKAVAAAASKDAAAVAAAAAAAAACLVSPLGSTSPSPALSEAAATVGVDASSQATDAIRRSAERAVRDRARRARAAGRVAARGIVAEQARAAAGGRGGARAGLAGAGLAGSMMLGGGGGGGDGTADPSAAAAGGEGSNALADGDDSDDDDDAAAAAARARSVGSDGAAAAVEIAFLDYDDDGEDGSSGGGGVGGDGGGSAGGDGVPTARARHHAATKRAPTARRYSPGLSRWSFLQLLWDNEGVFMRAPPVLSSAHRLALTERILSGTSEVHLLLPPLQAVDVVEARRALIEANRRLGLSASLLRSVKHADAAARGIDLPAVVALKQAVDGGRYNTAAAAAAQDPTAAAAAAVAAAAALSPAEAAARVASERRRAARQCRLDRLKDVDSRDFYYQPPQIAVAGAGDAAAVAAAAAVTPAMLALLARANDAVVSAAAALVVEADAVAAPPRANDASALLNTVHKAAARELGSEARANEVIRSTAALELFRTHRTPAVAAAAGALVAAAQAGLPLAAEPTQRLLHKLAPRTLRGPPRPRERTPSALDNALGSLMQWGVEQPAGRAALPLAALGNWASPVNALEWAGEGWLDALLWPHAPEEVRLVTNAWGNDYARHFDWSEEGVRRFQTYCRAGDYNTGLVARAANPQQERYHGYIPRRLLDARPRAPMLSLPLLLPIPPPAPRAADGSLSAATATAAGQGSSSYGYAPTANNTFVSGVSDVAKLLPPMPWSSSAMAATPVPAAGASTASAATTIGDDTAALLNQNGAVVADSLAPSSSTVNNPPVLAAQQLKEQRQRQLSEDARLATSQSSAESKMMRTCCGFFGVDLLAPPFTVSGINFAFLEAPAPFHVPPHVRYTRQYAGEQAALYFTFVTFIIYYLLPIALTGLVFTYFHLRDGSGNPATPWNAIIVLFWATWLIEAWTRKQSELAMHWGRRKYKNLERISYRFKPLLNKDGTPKTKLNQVTQAHDPYYPLLRRRLKVSFSVIFTLAAMAVVVAVQIAVTKLTPDGNSPEDQYKQIALSIASAVIIQVTKAVYLFCADKLTEWENYALESQADTSLNLKSFAFCFFNEFFTLYWIALGLDNNTDASTRLFIQLITLVLTSIATNILLQQVLPWARLRWATRSSTCCFCCRCKRASVLSNLAYFVREPELAAAEEARAVAEIRAARLSSSVSVRLALSNSAGDSGLVTDPLLPRGLALRSSSSSAGGAKPANSSRVQPLTAGGATRGTVSASVSTPPSSRPSSARVAPAVVVGSPRRVRFNLAAATAAADSALERAESADALVTTQQQQQQRNVANKAARRTRADVASQDPADAAAASAASSDPTTVSLFELIDTAPLVSGAMTWAEYARRVARRRRELRRRERLRGVAAAFSASAVDELALAVPPAESAATASAAAAAAAAATAAGAPSDAHAPWRYGYGPGFEVPPAVLASSDEEEEAEDDDDGATAGSPMAATVAAGGGGDFFNSGVLAYSRNGCNGATQLRSPVGVCVSVSKSRQERLVASAMLEALRPPATKLFNEYLTIMILLGYVMGFSSIFPEGPVAVVIAVWLERQGDLWRFLTVTQRALPISASDIGAWQIVLSFLSYASIVSNGIIIFYTSDQGRAIIDYDRDFMFVCFLLIVWTLKSLASRLVPDAATWVRWREERAELRQQEDERRFGHVSKEQAMATVAQLRDQVAALQGKVRELGGQ